MEPIKAYLRPYLRPYQRRLRQGVRQLKRGLLQPLRRLPLGAERSVPPLRWFASIEEWAKAEHGRYHLRYPAEQVQRAAPLSIEPDVHWKLQKEASRILPPIYRVELPHGRVWVHRNAAGHTDSLAVISRQNSLIGGLSQEFSQARHLGEHAVFSEFLLPKPHFLPGRALLLANIKGEQFYHWMLELLPRLSHYDEAALEAFDHIIVNDLGSSFMQESFALLGISEDKVVSLQDYPHIEAEYLSAPSPSGLSGNTPVWVVQWLREQFLPKIDISRSPGRKIYISRAQAAVRKVINETDLTDYLKNEGFDVLQLENMSLAEQIDAFATAETVISPHGAGLSHLVFCPPGCRVLEFFHPLYVNACFYALANSCGHRYAYAIGEGKRPAEGVDLEINIADILISTDTLRASMIRSH